MVLHLHLSVFVHAYLRTRLGSEELLLMMLLPSKIRDQHLQLQQSIQASCLEIDRCIIPAHFHLVTISDNLRAMRMPLHDRVSHAIGYCARKK